MCLYLEQKALKIVTHAWIAAICLKKQLALKITWKLQLVLLAITILLCNLAIMDETLFSGLLLNVFQNAGCWL